MKLKPTYEELLKKVEYYEKELKNKTVTDLKSKNSIDTTKQYLENLIRYANAPIIVWNAKFKIQRFNQAFEYLTGYTSEEAIGRKLDILFPKESIKQTKAAIDRTLSGDFWETIEIPILCKNGETKIALWNSANIYDDEKNLLSTIAQGNDITERIKTKNKLRVQHNKLENILNTFEDGVYLCDVDRNIEYVNSAMQTRIGYNAVGEKCYKAIHNLDEPCSFCYLDDLKKKGKTTIEYIIENKNYIISSVLLENDSKITVYTDVTKLKKTEENLLNKNKELQTLKEVAEENELYFRNIFDTQIDAISVTRVSDGTFTFVNKAFVNFTNFIEKELIGTRAATVNLFVNNEDVVKLNDEFFKKGIVSNFETEIQLKNNSIKTVLLSLKSFNYNREKFIVTTAHDITQSKIIDKALRYISGGWREKGPDLYYSILPFLTELLDIEFAFIDELIPGNKVKTVGLTVKNNMLPNIEYDLKDTPCEKVIAGEYCIHISNIKKLFPKDQILVDMNAESYAAIPLSDSKGDIIGILGVIGLKIIKNQELIKAVLKLIAPRIAHQVEQDKDSKKLAQNIYNLEEAQKIARVGNWELNFEHNILTWSKEIYNILEINPESYTPSTNTFFQFAHPDDREWIKSIFDKTIKENKDYNIEYRVLLKNNIIKWVIQRATREYDSKGKPTHAYGSLQDITEQKFVEQELQKTKEKFKTIVESTSEWIWEMDLNGVHTYSNPVVEKILGYSLSEIVGNHSFDIIHPVDVEDITKKLPNLIATKKGWENWEIKWIHKNGSYRYLESNAIPILDNEGKLEGYRGVDRDITQRKLSEKENVKLLTAVEQSANAIVITDINGNIEYTNPKFTELTGYTAAESIGKNPRILSSGLQSKIFYKQLWETVSSGNIWEGEFQNKTKNGHLYWEQTTITPIKNERGEIINYLAIKENITALKENQKQLLLQNEELHFVGFELSEKNRLLLESKNRFSNLFEKSPVSLWEEDFSLVIHFLEEKKKQVTNLKLYLDENPDFVYECISKVKVLNVNNITLDLLGVTTKDELLKHLRKSFNENSFNTFKYELVSLAAKEKEFVRETEFIHGDGSIVAVIIKSVLLEDNKTVLVSMVNITKIKAAEKKLKKQNKILKIAKEKAEESDRLKTEFLNNMSHEIRTPLNGILGFSELLCGTDTTVDKRNYFGKIIKNSGNQLMHVIDDIIEISKLGTKQVTAAEEEVCLNNVLLELFSIFDIKAKENKIPLYLKKGLLDAESIILTDEMKLNKILSNLLENAFKFTNEGFVEFGYLLKNKNETAQLEIYVKDTGVGINKANQKTIFDRFSQEEKELSRKFGGLGLGLSIAKENSELLGGTITLESEKGKGATFTVTIPYKPVNTIINTSKQTTTSKGGEGKLTLLIVEDEEVNYLFLETLLHDSIKLECNLLHAKNGKEAVDICRNNSLINLVLMDIKMPLMNGYIATKFIKEFNPNLPIIAQTAYSTSEDIKKSIAAGCDDFISKPISKKTLNTILNKHLKITLLT